MAAQPDTPRGRRPELEASCPGLRRCAQFSSVGVGVQIVQCACDLQRGRVPHLAGVGLAHQHELLAVQLDQACPIGWRQHQTRALGDELEALSQSRRRFATRDRQLERSVCPQHLRSNRRDDRAACGEVEPEVRIGRHAGPLDPLPVEPMRARIDGRRRFEHGGGGGRIASRERRLAGRGEPTGGTQRGDDEASRCGGKATWTGHRVRPLRGTTWPAVAGSA